MFTMKKIWLTLAIPCLLFPSCSKVVMEDPEVPQTSVLVFTAHCSDLTRTTMDDSFTPVWRAGDEVWISDGIHAEVCTVAAADDGKTSVDFTTTTLTGERIFAVSPASSCIDFAETRSEAERVYYNIPTHTDGSFSKANISVAYTTRTTPVLKFKNATSLIEFTRTEADVTQITLETAQENGGNLSGKFSINYTSASVYGISGWNSNSITVDLDGNGPWYVAINPCTLEAGSKIILTDSNGNQYERTLSQGNTFHLNKIKTISVDAAYSGATQVASGSWAGSGTSTDPYLIASAADLERLANNVNSGTTYSGVCFKQIADIAVTASKFPIGRNESYLFKGVFDGDFHTITFSGAHPTSQYYGGLFGYVDGAKLQKIRVAGTIEQATSSDQYYTYMRYFGSVCAYAAGTTIISHCSSSLNTGGLIMSKKFLAAGGLVGYAGGRTMIRNSCNTGSVQFLSSNSGNSFYAAGLCGWVKSSIDVAIESCYNTGYVRGETTFSGYGPKVAGIASSDNNASVVYLCYNQGNINSIGRNNNSNDARAAGLTFNAQVSYSYNSGEVWCYYVANNQYQKTAARTAGIACVPNNSGTYKLCFALTGEGYPENLFQGTPSTQQNCCPFTLGDETNGGVVSGYEGYPGLLDAMRSTYSTNYGSELFVIGPPPGYFPVFAPEF